MNNSRIALENSEKEEDNRLSFLQKKQGELAQLVETINRIEANEDWQKLRALLFDTVLEGLERELRAESEKNDVNLPTLYRIQGQLAWARKYGDLTQFVEWKKRELEGINKQIKDELNPRDGAL